MYLLATHAVLWMLGSVDKLSDAVRSIIRSSESVYISMISFWEIEIKKNKGRLVFDHTIKEAVETCRRNGIYVLDIKAHHLDTLALLPMIHGDPFDRLLVAQAISEDMTIVTKDENIRLYGARTVW